MEPLKVKQYHSTLKLSRLDALADKRDNLEDALSGLKTAQWHLEQEGIYVCGSLIQMISQVERMILQVQDEAQEIGGDDA